VVFIVTVRRKDANIAAKHPACGYGL